MTENGLEVIIYKATVSMYDKFDLTCCVGKRHGRGEYLYNDGSRYLGNWENDIIKGEGTSWYPNGNK